MRYHVELLVRSFVQNLTSLVLSLALAVPTVLTLALTGITAAVFPEATDRERMREVMARHLRAPGGPPVEVVACSVEFSRRGGGRSLFQYQVTLRDPAERREWTQVVSGVAYGGKRTRTAWERLQWQYFEPPTTRSGLVRAAYVPELDLLLQVFPFDHQLPALEPLMAGSLPGLVNPLLAQFSPGSWQLVGWEAEAVRYRVDLRACVRLSAQAQETSSGEVAERRVFAKVYASHEAAERAWGVQRDVAAAINAEDAPVAVAPLVAYLPEARVLVQDEVQDPSLLKVLRTSTSREEAVAVARRAGRAIAALHQLPIAAPPHRLELDRMDPERLRRAAAQLRTASPDLAPLVTAVEESILAGMAALGELPSVPVHGDLKPNHILPDGERVVLLDLDKFAAGEPMLDVTNLLFHLRRSGSWVTEAFVEEYFAHVPAAWKPRLAPHYAWALFREAARVAQTGKHKRPFTALLREARAVVAGEEWSPDPDQDRDHGQADRGRERRARDST
jgi:hypothetical protein